MTPDPRLLLPATRALLEGWSGPVVVHGRATVAWWDNGACSVWVEETPDGAGYWVIPEMVSPSFDLSRAECRDRVARVVSLTVGLVSPVPLWYRSNSSRPPYGEWSLGGSWPTMTSFSGLGGTMGGVIHRVPALADLDPNDPAPLPDGSRRVDALALAAVASHVLGGSDAR